jgi:ribosomal protein S18 acetylase RimI-like enzyme
MSKGVKRTAKEIRIRPWRKQDLVDVQRITWASWLATYSSFIPEYDLRRYFDVHYALEALDHLYSSRGVHGFVAEMHKVVVGCEKTEFNAQERRFYISSLHVVKEHQGKGVGGQLLHAAEECARRYDVDRVWLGVMIENVHALGWYKNLGFHFVEEAPFTMGATTVSHLIGWKTIGVSQNFEEDRHHGQ